MAPKAKPKGSVLAKPNVARRRSQSPRSGSPTRTSHGRRHGGTRTPRSSQNPEDASSAPGRLATNPAVTARSIPNGLENALHAHLKKGVLQAFQEWDDNASGFIEERQFAQVLAEIGVDDADIPSLFKAADANHDSHIDYNEFISWVFAVAPSAVPVDSAPLLFPEFGDQATRDGVQEIVPNLYLSNWRGAANLPLLRELGICSVVCAVGQADENPHPDELVYLNIENVEDEESQAQALMAHFEAAARFIHVQRRNGGVVVHCAAGISRSSSTVLYYLMKHEHLSLREAFAHTRARRCVIWPNIGFMARLIDCELALGANVASIDLAEYEVWTQYSPYAYADAKVVDRPGHESHSAPWDEAATLSPNGIEEAHSSLPASLDETAAQCPSELVAGPG